MTQLTRSTEPPSLGSIVLHRGTYRRAVMRLGDLNQLTKPRIAVMVALTTGVGFGLGIRAATMHGLAAANFSWLTLIAALVGTAMSCMSASRTGDWRRHPRHGRADDVSHLLVHRWQRRPT